MLAPACSSEMLCGPGRRPQQPGLQQAEKEIHHKPDRYKHLCIRRRSLCLFVIADGPAFKVCHKKLPEQRDQKRDHG